MTPKRALRPNQIYGRGNPIPVGRTKFFEDLVYCEGGDELIPGTSIPRLRLTRLGPRVLVGFADEVDAIVEALRAARDAKPVKLVKSVKLMKPTKPTAVSKGRKKSPARHTVGASA
jgi:hypothetical protein